MERINNLFLSLFNLIPGATFGILSVLAGVIGDFLAFLYYPGYNIFDNMVSDLGIGPGGIFFNIGIIISGLLAVFFFVYIGNVLRSNNNSNSNRESILRKIGLVCAYNSSFSLSLIGVFPAYEEIPIIFLLHGIFAFSSWISAMGYLLLFSYLFFKDSRISKFLPYSALCLLFLFVFFFLTFSPLTEWILNFAIIAWWFYFPSMMLYKGIK